MAFYLVLSANARALISTYYIYCAFDVNMGERGIERTTENSHWNSSVIAIT